MTSRTTRTTPRNTRITSRTIRTIHIRSPLGGLLIGMVLMVLVVILVVLGLVLVVLGVVLRQCSEQMFGTDSVRKTVPSQHSCALYCRLIFCAKKATILSFILAKFARAGWKIKFA